MTPAAVPDIEGTKAVLVASTGGHLAQLFRLFPRLGLADDPLWITFDNPQARSLLAGRRTLFVPYIAPRDLRGVLKAIRPIHQAIKSSGAETVLSTGSAIALSALPVAANLGRKSIYIESVSRFDGPSLTGKLLAADHRIHLFTQHENWATNRWVYRFSVLDEYAVSTESLELRKEPLRIFVTLGTIKPYRFDALVDQVIRLAPDAEIVWQLGATERDDVPGLRFEAVSGQQFDDYAHWADVIVAHAGVGSALHLLDLGKRPVLVPRRRARGEHVDDHQAQIAAHLGSRSLVVAREVDDLQYSDFLVAAAGRISRG